MIDKSLILNELIEIFSQDLEKAKKIASDARELINQPDMKQEGKYDTRRTEAQYLAGAQAVRVTELEGDIERLQHLNLPSNNEKITIGSLVKCEVDSKEVIIFLSPSSGMTLNTQGQVIQVTSHTSPLGDSLMGMEEGDYFEVESPRGEIEYEILEVF
jgi:transcription elongation GreA/GreB family factor